MSPLKGKVALVAGATRGAGRAIAIELAGAGVAFAQSEELKEFNIAAVALCPGFLRSEAMLDHFKVSESNWRDAIAQDEHFAESETPYYVARALRALALEPNIMSKTGQALATWNLYKEYGFSDLDGSQPDWGAYARAKLGIEC